MTRTRAAAKKETTTQASAPKVEPAVAVTTSSERRSLRSSGRCIKKEIVDDGVSSSNQINLNISTRSKAISKSSAKNSASLNNGKNTTTASKLKNSTSVAIDFTPAAPGAAATKVTPTSKQSTDQVAASAKMAITPKITVSVDADDIIQDMPPKAASVASRKNGPKPHTTRSSIRNNKVQVEMDEDICLPLTEPPVEAAAAISTSKFKSGVTPVKSVIEKVVTPPPELKKQEKSKPEASSSKKRMDEPSDPKPTVAPVSSTKPGSKAKVTSQPTTPVIKMKETPIVKPSANDPLYNFGEYSEKLINWSILKKFDMQAAIEQQMLGTNQQSGSGESTLTRATLDKLIKQALPSDQVRVHRDSIDLICHLANQFVDLISDIANNCCYQKEKVLMFPEHMLCAMQELNLDDYLLSALFNEQEFMSPQELKEAGTKEVDIEDFNLFRNDETKAKMTVSVVKEEREKLVQTVLRRLRESNDLPKKSRRTRKPNGIAGTGLTQKQLEEMQRSLFEDDKSQNANLQNKLLKEAAMAEARDNAAHALFQDGMQYNNGHQYQQQQVAYGAEAYGTDQHQQQQQYEQQWADYKQNWITYNQVWLDQQYEAWVSEHVTYNQQKSAESQATGQIDEGLIIDPQMFKQTYGPVYFYDLKYQEFFSQQYYDGAAQDPGTVQQPPVAEEPASAAQQQYAEAPQTATFGQGNQEVLGQDVNVAMQQTPEQQEAPEVQDEVEIEPTQEQEVPMDTDTAIDPHVDDNSAPAATEQVPAGPVEATDEPAKQTAIEKQRDLVKKREQQMKDLDFDDMEDDE